MIVINAESHCTSFDSQPRTLAELEDALCAFISDHDGARWHARFAVLDNAVTATCGDQSCVWTLTPKAVAGAEAMIVKTLAEFRALENEEREVRRLALGAATLPS